MLERVLAAVTAVSDPGRAVVVGRPDGVPAGFTVVADDPPDGGPAAAIGRGAAVLGSLDAPGPSPDASRSEAVRGVVFVLAADLPFITGSDLLALETERRRHDADVAMAVDRDGHRQPLCAVWRHEALIAAVVGRRDAAGLHGRPVRVLLEGLRVHEVADTVGFSTDVDTPGDLERAREVAAQMERSKPSQ